MPFDIFQNHESVTCFSCQQVIDGKAKSSGHPQGRGEYVKQCKCGLYTWYDIGGASLIAAATPGSQRSITVNYWYPRNEPKLGEKPFASRERALGWAREFCVAFKGGAVSFEGFVPETSELHGITLKN